MSTMNNLAITGALLALHDGPRRLTLRLAGGIIASIGGSPQRGDRVVDLTGCAIFPGLINACDVLDLNTFPRVKWQSQYGHARLWQRQFDAWLAESAPAIPLDDRLLIGGFKNLLAGATTVLHHGELVRSLRSRRFPVRVVQRYGLAPSLLGLEDPAESCRRTPPDVPWLIALAEGIDEIAANELAILDGAGCLRQNTRLVHGVGLTGADLRRIVEVGAGLIWCPETSRFLFGEARFHRALLGRMALGSGPRVTGSLDLLEDLKLAAHVSQLTPRRLLEMALTDAARLLYLPDRGRLALNAPADLIVIAHDTQDPYDILLGCRRADLRLVMIGGEPRIGDPELEPAFRATRTAFEPVMLDGVPKLLARDLAHRLRRSGLVEPGLELD